MSANMAQTIACNVKFIIIGVIIVQAIAEDLGGAKRVNQT